MINAYDFILNNVDIKLSVEFIEELRCKLFFTESKSQIFKYIRDICKIEFDNQDFKDVRKYIYG